MQNLLRKVRGISLLEVILSLAIIAIIIMLATRYFGIASESENINNASEMLQTARSASNRWLLINQNSLKDISVQALIDHDLLPTGFGKNPWGGDVIIQQAENAPGKIEIKFTDIPQSACQNLSAAFKDPTVPTPLDTCHVKDNKLSDYIGEFTP